MCFIAAKIADGDASIKMKEKKFIGLDRAIYAKDARWP